MSTAIEVRGVTVRYGDVLALDDVSLNVRSGGVTGLIGMNGSGKSTLFKTIAGIIRPDRGDVLVDAAPPRDARRRGVVGYVPQSEAVDWAFPVSVREVVMMGRYRRMGFTRRPRPADRAAVDDALARGGLADLADRQIGRLSGGQRKRAFVARGIAQDARVLLLDEPFAGVDKRSEETMVRLLRELAAEGRAVLVSTHDLQALPDLAEDAVVLQNRVVFRGSAREAVQPENLARAFGVGPDDRRRS